MSVQICVMFLDEVIQSIFSIKNSQNSSQSANEEIQSAKLNFFTQNITHVIIVMIKFNISHFTKNYIDIDIIT